MRQPGTWARLSHLPSGGMSAMNARRTVVFASVTVICFLACGGCRTTAPPAGNGTPPATEQTGAIDAINTYYSSLTAGDPVQAYDLLARAAKSRKTVEQFASDFRRAYKSITVKSIVPYSQWLVDQGRTGGTADPELYVVAVREEWNDDWIPVRPAGDNIDFVKVAREDGVWKITSIGTLPERPQLGGAPIIAR